MCIQCGKLFRMRGGGGACAARAPATVVAAPENDQAERLSHAADVLLLGLRPYGIFVPLWTSLRNSGCE
jgi:hypothetical protein